MARATAIMELAFLCLASGSQAEDGGSVFRFFDRFCLSRGPDYQRTVAIAETNRWLPLPTEMLVGLVPLANLEAVEGWAVSGNGLPQQMILEISKHTLNGKSVHACTMVAFGTDSIEFEKAFFQRTDGEAIQQVHSATHVHKLYDLELSGRSELVTLTVPAESNGADNLMASSIAEAEWEN
ncbi:hypothetical protein HJB79_05250 [Rhizobium lentis]|uniref:hypothetical protein n=1 Tax=Rhizobium TaxID=379 RepID=UPI0016084E7F|nr:MULTISPECIES: hypothetical protein [Rhizobium]MBB3352567.1 hypothetical protein [Rhizobium sp. BK049]MBX5138213.1 hypothetical protein [Rhizobium lentis]MBX5151317.1 hypothetical protein [Rhizobium lentis]MBX5176433.1 hypothetical protein [Rhizobium lentis]